MENCAYLRKNPGYAPANSPNAYIKINDIYSVRTRNVLKMHIFKKLSDSVSEMTVMSWCRPHAENISRSQQSCDNNLEACVFTAFVHVFVIKLT